MHDTTTEIEKQYRTAVMAGRKTVDVRITVEGPDGDDVLELADVLREAVADAHREYREGGDDG
jgi:transcriptional regulator